MNPLKPFDAQFLKDFRISADIKMQQNQIIKINYEFNDPKKEVQFNNLKESFHSNQIKRENELWKATCFELFLNPVGEKKYYEFNFSLKPAWNAYVFEDYRSPAIPTETFDFDLKKIDFNKTNLEIEILNQTKYSKFNVSLTAVIQNTKNQNSYFALIHSESKPDFHSLKSFTLQRGS